MTEPALAISAAGLTYRIRAPETRARKGVLMLHGLGGDEGVMWVFQNVIPDDWIAVAPRGPFASPAGGWGWTRTGSEHLSPVAEFRDASREVRRFCAGLSRELDISKSAWVWMGFSQGAALAFAASLAPGTHSAAVVALAGFLPEGIQAADLARLARTPIYWGHGTQDEHVPVERARQDVARLRAASADVTFCEAEVGHKLGIECLRGLGGWLKARA